MSFPNTNLERLMIELSDKKYLKNPHEYELILRENGLEPTDIYDKKTMQKRMLSTVLSILEILSNNIDLFRSVETEFATVGEAYRYLEKRMDRLERTIASLPDDDDVQGSYKSRFNYMFHD